ncbi:MAG: pilus assembly protein TadG-related protein [Candidatus Binatus sp.]
MIRSRAYGRGQVLVLYCLALFVLMGFLALAVDVGLLWNDRRQMQTAADAAAIAGMNALQGNISCSAGTSTTNCPPASDVAAINGYAVNGPNSTTVTVALPTSLPNVGSGTFVQVNVSQAVPTYFMRAFNALFGGTSYNTVNVGATAIAGYTTGTGCVIGLNASAANTISITGSGSINAPKCNAVDNSNNSSSALVTSGSGSLTANAISVVGGASGTGFSPTPTTGVAPITDPLGYLTAPTVGSCMGDPDKSIASGGNGGTIGPGTYCGGIKVSGGHTLNLNPGLYILNGGGLNVSASTINGTGVSFFNTGTASGTTGYKPIDISGTSTATLSAPTSELTGVTGGPWEGILFFQDRGICTGTSFCDTSGHTSGNQNTLSGGSNGNFQGVLYFPDTPVTYSGGSSSPGTGYTVLIGDAITISGPSSFGSDYSSLTDGSPIKTTALYE